ncbi:hypothetical protein PR202_ga22937 [Eleusine coracana subsp. coracana]|uniref:Uncharacterized protein n=1 Tax=Eleusine coracana subsp. coracana TaxID=191504 RepID=A0AAV5D4I4_ELECO|nr:hypothetical protein PR202_ga22934 [Eleusine coracana subsp. coracana]GJN05318.1 hypothetical protein PR202_ga22937 [Eleusine coracana subsp. coracana]
MVGHGCGGSGGGASEATAMSPAAGGGGKRGRDAEEDVYVDNLHSHKRYLSEVMASSMNGLSVGDSVTDNAMRSPVRMENTPCFRYSHLIPYVLSHALPIQIDVHHNVPLALFRTEWMLITIQHILVLSLLMLQRTLGMSVSCYCVDNLNCSHHFRDETTVSEKSEDFRSYDNQVNTSRNQTDMSSSSTSPISSPNRFQKPNTCSSSGNQYPLPSSSLSAVASSNVRRGTEHEGRIPSSPNDMCHSGDLRRTALLRSVQMRVQGLHPRDLLFRTEHDREQECARINAADELGHKDENLEGAELEHRSCPRSIQDAAFGQHTQSAMQILSKECRSDYDATNSMFNHNDILQ